MLTNETKHVNEYITNTLNEIVTNSIKFENMGLLEYSQIHAAINSCVTALDLDETQATFILTNILNVWGETQRRGEPTCAMKESDIKTARFF